MCGCLDCVVFNVPTRPTGLEPLEGWCPRCSLQGFHSTFATELRQIVVYNGPVRAGIIVVVTFWLAVNLAVQARKSDINDLRFRLTKHLATAVTTEASCALLRTLVVDDAGLSRCNPKPIWRDSHPSHEAGTVRTSTHRAVTMATEKRRQLDLELYRTTEATSRYL